ncbi:remorin [Solanum lycopersicum]|uniref:Remorin n=2 Tax=Solanum subgen. Lycopersicon TaxID=49274 RepID=A0A3Q7GU06_SOLLC|nr:remorin [Solanum lycopersicum]XP_015080171.1 remorin-like [Solanum pennellii]
MGEEEAKKVETAEHAAEEKAIVLSTVPPSEESKDKPDDSKALVIVEPETKALVPVEKKGSIDRDATLARLTTEKRLSLIKAWEESEKAKAENKAQKKIAEILAWENSKKASLEAELKRTEEQLLKKKAEYIEKLKNKIALVHKSAEEKRAITEAKRGEDLLTAEEMAAKCRATGSSPKKPLLGCF